MGGFNLSFFNLIHGLSGRNFAADSAGIFTAEYLPYFIGIAFFFLAFSEKGLRKKIFFMAEAVIAVILSRGIITEAMRFFYFSPRPFDALNFQPLIPESGSSLPSGHMAFFFALSMIIYFYNKHWGIWYFLLSAIIGVARIFVGVHWPSDIIAGMLIGVLSGIFVHWLLADYFKKLKEEPALQ
ncbi:MAG TPA: phosphatase PAP2 family protein [Candidatus Paceibacterota bacterium]|nr:phosphatase PAP2 family protein [Candidatus Paceibacterota bacterium]